MFPIPWNFPFRKKNGDLSTIGDVIGGGGGSDLPPHSASDAGKLLGVKLDGSLEWSDEVNSEIQTLTKNVDVLAKNGAVNLLPNNASTQTINGITFTVNSDGTITANGTSTDVCILAVDSSTRTLALDGSYRLSGCPSGGSNDTYLLRINPATGSFVYDYGNGATTTLSSNILIKVEIRINSGITVDNLIFKPMIADADYSGDYVPYAKSNKELTDDVKELTVITGQIARLVSFSSLTTYIAKKYGKVVELQFTGTLNEAVNPWTDFLTVPDGFRPSHYVQFVSFKTYNSVYNLQSSPAGGIQSGIALASGDQVRFTVTYIID